MLIFLTSLFATLNNAVLDLPFPCCPRLENLALRHHSGVLRRSARKRPKLTSGDRLLWICLSRLWRDWLSAMAICSNSASTSRRAASANTCCAAASRRLRPGAHFWRTRSSWSPSTPSRCPRSVSRWDEKVLYVFLVLAHDRRRILHFNVTAHSTAEWTGQQLREAFPLDQIPRYLLRDRG